MPSRHARASRTIMTASTASQTDQLAELLRRFPPLDNKARYEMLNSFQVVGDHLSVRSKPATFSRVWSMINGEDTDRTNEMFGNLSQAADLLRQQVSHLEASKVHLHGGMRLLAQECERLQRGLERLGAGLPDGESLTGRMAAMDQRLRAAEMRHDAHLIIDRVASDLRAGGHDSLPLLMRLILAVELVAFESGAALEPGDSHLFSRAVNQITDAIVESEGLEQHQRGTLIPINALIRECCGMSPDARAGIALLSGYGAETGTISTLLLDVTSGDAKPTSDEIDQMTIETGMPYVMPLEHLVREMLHQAAERWKPKSHVLPEVCEQSSLRMVAEPFTVNTGSLLQPGQAMDRRKIGLVLSGGGAKGAYLVGVLKAMAEHGLQPSAVSGTSIGALNGAIIASCKDVGTAAKTLHDVWMEMSKASPVCFNGWGMAVMLAGALVRVAGASVSPRAMPLVAKMTRAAERFAERQGIALSVLNVEPVTEILEGAVNFESVKEWLPFWVAAFRGSASESVWEAIKGYGLNLDNKPSDFFRIQDHEPEDVQALILASAALPVLYPRQTLGDSIFFDGGIGGARRQQGNTPVTPLIEYGCERCIVTHLSNGSLWSRSAFPTVEILEIRPSDDLAHEGGIKAMLNFSPEKIHLLIEMGYQDASATFKAAYDASQLGQASHQAWSQSVLGRERAT